MQIISPYAVYFNRSRIVKELEVWRLISSYFYFGNLGRNGYRSIDSGIDTKVLGYAAMLLLRLAGCLIVLAWLARGITLLCC